MRVLCLPCVLPPVLCPGEPAEAEGLLLFPDLPRRAGEWCGKLPPKTVHVPIPGTYEYGSLRGRGTCPDGI